MTVIFYENAVSEDIIGKLKFTLVYNMCFLKAFCHA